MKTTRTFASPICQFLSSPICLQTDVILSINPSSNFARHHAGKDRVGLVHPPPSTPLSPAPPPLDALYRRIKSDSSWKRTCPKLPTVNKYPEANNFYFYFIFIFLGGDFWEKQNKQNGLQRRHDRKIMQSKS